MDAPSKQIGPLGVRLRFVGTDDLAWLAAMASDKTAVGEHNWGGGVSSRSEILYRLQQRHSEDGCVNPESGTLVVELGDGTPIGDVSWRPTQWGPTRGSRCPVFGIALLPEFRGHGYGTDAQGLLISYLFEQTPAHRIQSDTATDNPAEHRVLLKVGMRVEGVIRDAEFRNGKYVDHSVFGILRGEWEEQHREISPQ